jgi:DNA-binding transcriptional LysR family regulator
MKLPEPRRSGLAFSHYDQVVQSAIAGQGVALGRVPLVDELIADGRLALALRSRQFATRTERAYWLIVSPASARRAEVGVFTDWLRVEAERAAKAVGRPGARGRR